MTKSKQKITVLGAKGMLGHAVSHYFRKMGYDVDALSRAQFDISKDSFSKLMELTADTSLYVNCAGVIKPRLSATSMEDLLQVNTVFPKNLARYAFKQRIPCIHITTDCVYSGRRGRYNEEDLFDPEDIYGTTKLAGEPPECMVLRTSIVGEEYQQARSLLEWARNEKGKTVNGYTNHLWNGVTTLHLAEIILKIFEDDFYSPGTFHVFSHESSTKAGLLALFNEVYRLDLSIQPVEATSKCDRTLSTVKELCSKLAPKPLKVQLIEMRDFFSGRANT